MPKVTSVEHQKKNPHRFNIFLDGQFAFGADEDLIVDYCLLRGKTISQENLNKLLFEAEAGKLIDRVYNLYSIRERSEKEIRDYFKLLSFKNKIKGKEKISPEIVDLVVEKLRRKGVINDLRFAKAWVESRRKSKQKGMMAIKAELYQKGIDREIVEEVVGGQSAAGSEEELAKQALEKKLKSWKNTDKPTLYKKAIEFLLRRGFEYGVAKSVVGERLKST